MRGQLPEPQSNWAERKYYLNHPLLHPPPLLFLVHPEAGRHTPEHKIPLHAHDSLHRAVTAILGNRVLDLDDVTDAHAAAASIAFGHQHAVAAHGERGHHRRASGAMDREHVRADEVGAGDEFEGRQQGNREVEQEIATMEGHEDWRGLGQGVLMVAWLVCWYDGGLGSSTVSPTARYVIMPRLRDTEIFLILEFLVGREKDQISIHRHLINFSQMIIRIASSVSLLSIFLAFQCSGRFSVDS